MEPKKVNKRTILLLVPLFIVAGLAGVFHLLGGGSGGSEAQAGLPKGFNRNLPDASFKKELPKNKLDFYEQAEHDSLRAGENSPGHSVNGYGFDAGRQKAQTDAIGAKLALINKVITEPGQLRGFNADQARLGFSGASIEPADRLDPSGQGMKKDVDRLEALMRTMQEEKGEDPEVSQLNGMLDKIISIQNPGSAAQKMRADLPPADSQFRAVPAVIVNKQRVRQDATVKLRLQDSMRVSGVLIPSGHELFGSCKLASHRLLIQVSNIRIGRAIIPADLSVYSLDGMPGVDAPEAELGRAAGSGARDALQGMQFLSMDQSVGVQAAGAGIDAAKSLLGKKVSRIRVKLEAGQKVLLRNNKNKGQ